MVAVRDVNVPPAADLPLIVMVEVIEPVQVMQVPGSGGALTVDLQGEKRFMATSVAGGLNSASDPF
jgi:hypothetical protein